MKTKMSYLKWFSFYYFSNRGVISTAPCTKLSKMHLVSGPLSATPTASNLTNINNSRLRLLMVLYSIFISLNKLLTFSLLQMYRSCTCTLKQ